MLLASMTGVGIAWASILSMPYAILSGCLPANKTGTYMGIFNFFIVIPEICASLAFGKVMEKVLTNDNALVRLIGGDNRLTAVVLGGVFMLVAASIVFIVPDNAAANPVSNSEMGESKV